MEQNRFLIILVAILLAVVAVSVGVLYLMPSDKSSAPVSNTVSNTVTDTSTSSAELNTNVLQKQSYQALDTKPVQDGSLPVPPPDGVGKANPFL